MATPASKKETKKPEVPKIKTTKALSPPPAKKPKPPEPPPSKKVNVKAMSHKGTWIVDIEAVIPSDARTTQMDDSETLLYRQTEGKIQSFLYTTQLVELTENKPPKYNKEKDTVRCLCITGGHTVIDYPTVWMDPTLTTVKLAPENIQIISEVLKAPAQVNAYCVMHTFPQTEKWKTFHVGVMEELAKGYAKVTAAAAAADRMFPNSITGYVLPWSMEGERILKSFPAVAVRKQIYDLRRTTNCTQQLKYVAKTIAGVVHPAVAHAGYTFIIDWEPCGPQGAKGTMSFVDYTLLPLNQIMMTGIIHSNPPIAHVFKDLADTEFVLLTNSAYMLDGMTIKFNLNVTEVEISSNAYYQITGIQYPKPIEFKDKYFPPTSYQAGKFDLKKVTEPAAEPDIWKQYPPKPKPALFAEYLNEKGPEHAYYYKSKRRKRADDTLHEAIIPSIELKDDKEFESIQHYYISLEEYALLSPEVKDDLHAKYFPKIYERLVNSNDNGVYAPQPHNPPPQDRDSDGDTNSDTDSAFSMWHNNN